MTRHHRAQLILASAFLAGCSSGPRMEQVCVETRREIRYHTAMGLALPVMHEVCVRYEMRPVRRKF